MKHAPATFALTLVAIVLTSGCGGQDLSGRFKKVRNSLQQARDRGAYVCAPRELAASEVHLERSEQENKRGEHKRALEQVELADRKAHEALRRSAACAKDAPTSNLDSDGDGLPDFQDRCPKVAEDMDGFQDEDGCPDTDNDEDGVPDAYDRCPNEPEDHDGFDDEDGCPDTDNDHDGIPDPDDKCPNQHGPAEAGGCPKTSPHAHISVTQEKIEPLRPVVFAPGKAVLLQRSFALLSEIADVLKTRPTMRIRVEGHTDSRGTSAENRRLSQARAEAIKTLLVSRGVAPGRLEAEGFGSEQPIETNKTKAGREKNQRVEFVILQQ